MKRVPRYYWARREKLFMFKRFVSPALFGLLCLILLMWQFCPPVFAQAQPQRALEAKQETAPPRSAKQILVLYTYAGGITVNQKATGAFFSVLTSRGLNNDDVFLEYLDLQRNNSPAYRRRVANLLLDKYGKRDIGLIVTVHTWALEFLLEECKGLFPDVPIFSFLVARPELIKAKNTGRRILLRPQNMDMGGTLEIALKMFPETRKVFFVVGAAPADKRFEHEARQIFEPWRGKVEIEYTSDRTYEEMLQLVATLPGRSIVIYCNVFSDVTGRTFTPLEVGKIVAKAANAPVFCIWDTIMGWGTIGGSLLSFEAEGAEAAKVVLDMLKGKIVLTKPVTTLPSSKTFMFDRQQLKRWGVNENILPEGTVLVNHVPTSWEQHKGFVIAVFVVFLAQTLLVVGLLVERRRKIMAEEALKEQLGFERLISDLSAKFQNIAPSEIDREIEGALKRIVDFFRVSHSVLIKGFRGERRALITHAAHADDIPPTPLAGNPYSLFPWTSEILAQGKIIWIPTLDRLPAEAAVDKETYMNLGVRSFVIIPILIETLPGYAISISLHKEGQVWPEVYMPQLKLLGEILVNTLERKQAVGETIQLRNDLAHVQRVSTMGELSSALAHELNQPLGAILNNASAAQILSSKLAGENTELREILADIISDAMRAGDVIRKIRGIVKKAEVKFGQLNVNVLIEDVVALYRNAFNIEKISSSLDLRPDLPPIRGDRVQLQQVLMNLINNASEAMRESSPKALRIRSIMQPPDMIMVSVSDSGTGIDEAKKDKVFDQFFTTKKDGLGMGLRICQSIIEDHGGRMWVENNRDAGATFSFSLRAYQGDSG